MRWVAVGGGALLVLGLVTVLALWWYASAKLDEIDIPALTENRTDPDAPQDVIEGTMNVLVVGNASREGLTEEQLLELGTEDDGSALTDTIMVVQISPVRDEAVVVSVPRDLRVDPPGEVGVVKINSVSSRGGPDLLVRTIQDLTGLPIDHYVEIDMAGFLHLANALGGVEVCLDEPLRDDYAGVDLPAGCQELSGPDALGFVRSRRVTTEQFGADDFGRIAKQQYFISQAMDEVAAAGTLLNPFKVKSLIDAVASAVTTDRDLGLADMWRIANTLKSFDASDVTMRTVPGYAATEDGQSFVFPYPEQAEELFQTLRDGEDLADLGIEVPSELAPGDVAVLVINGVGREGLASDVSAFLTDRDFQVVDALNPQDLDPQATWDPELEILTIQHGPDGLAQAELLLERLGDLPVELVEVDSVDLPDGVDVILVVGGAWTTTTQ